ncbi:MAG: glycyl-tRNA synthetase subunit beta [Betaproteobacteria bacterium SG8_39]|nr:MAG: glycyl-tRNA synthetase subunit beta [Betaproteobacteria bacterium SG8_39]
MADATLLVELLTEELPPKSLERLSLALRDEIANGLLRHQLANGDAGAARAFATPRRLAMCMPGVAARAPDRMTEVQGPSVSAPAKAAEGFAKKHGLALAALEQRETPKGNVWLARVQIKGASLDSVLAEVVSDAVRKLPIAKLMRWGDGEAQFVRPVHGLVMLHGSHVVPGTVLGLAAGRITRGHRFLGASSIELADAEAYERRLLEEGRVIADFAARRSEIEGMLQAEAKRQGAALGETRALLDEVTSLVELPTVYVGRFDAAFLDVPQECLILTMQQNQKYFPLFDAAGKLLPKFLIVSNMRVDDARHIVGGNERVVRPRLEDARFFYEQDRRTRLESRVPQLARVVYHNKLGSQLERVERIQLLAGSIARALDADSAAAERAAWLAKADLLTGMVGEFPELQGVMGRSYALNDGEAVEVADAIEMHYWPRFAGDRLPEDRVACAVALADKLDAMAGLFSIGQQPTGDKDPFGLRRAALGVIRILVERTLPLSLFDLVRDAFASDAFKRKAVTEMQAFIFDRLAGYLKDLGYTTLQVDAVLSMRPAQLSLVPKQLEAVRSFQDLPEAESLAAANKRVSNLLRQAQAKGESFANAKLAELPEPAEQALHRAIQSTAATANPLYERGDYTGYLKAFAVLKEPVDTFFDKVMVMVEDDRLRRGRLALLADLREAMNRIADISKLAA